MKATALLTPLTLDGMCRRMLFRRLLLLSSVLAVPVPALARPNPVDAFRQLEEILPTPDEVRLGSGHPGPKYWQQRADYRIEVELDDRKQGIEGRGRIRYHNRSPHTLTYLWLQLDNNIFARDSDGALAAPSPKMSKLNFRDLARQLEVEKFDGTITLTKVTDQRGRKLDYTVVKTMMRVELDAPLEPGKTSELVIEWRYRINDATVIRARTGYEYFKKDGNYIYEIAHWYPRMVAYTDVHGWHHKQFLGRGEFTLEFGDFEVRITAPADHVVAATGVLQNPEEVLTAAQRARLDRARKSAAPVFIVTPKEAKANEKKKSRAKKTWVFKAKNVRDFAFASSRKFIWDAMTHKSGDRSVLAMSFYPNEAEPLWSRYSTRAIVHTMDIYSRYTFDYPYPVAISVNGPVGGMEYPMICFNGPRPDKDGTYFGKTTGWSRRFSKYALISVIIHEVGHNYFPMIVNTDERQWTWMDEGINTFLQFLAEQEWEEDYPSRRGYPEDIVPFMTSRDQMPIMTNSESLKQFGNNAYAKAATAMNILRETILGRELFDYAFREYARQWRFKRPMPADFFRIMEDASGVDLDWFWRGWFYSIDHVDIAIGEVREYELETRNPDIDKPRAKRKRAAEPDNMTDIRNRGVTRLVQRIEGLKDFYNAYDELDVTPEDREAFKKYLKTLDEKERGLLGTQRSFYVVDFHNKGGLVMPVILQIEYDNGKKELMRIPPEIWAKNPRKTSKLLMAKRPIKSLLVDPYLETADADVENNRFPRRPVKSKFRLFKEAKTKSPMQKVKEAAEQAEKDEKERRRRKSRGPR